jgi:hypothetical protein
MPALLPAIAVPGLLPSHLIVLVDEVWRSWRSCRHGAVEGLEAWRHGGCGGLEVRSGGRGGHADMEP